MDLHGLALLPVRVTVAATQATLALGHLASPQGPVLREGGYAARLAQVFAEGGLLDQLGRILADERGPIGLANTLADLTSDDRPLGKALAREGLLDRMVDEDGPLYRALSEGGLLDQLLLEEGILEKLLAPGGTLDQLVELGETFDAIVPRLEALGRAIPDLNAAVTVLSEAVEPLGALAGRLPGGRRRPVVVE